MSLPFTRKTRSLLIAFESSSLLRPPELYLFADEKAVSAKRAQWKKWNLPEDASCGVVQLCELNAEFKERLKGFVVEQELVPVGHAFDEKGSGILDSAEYKAPRGLNDPKRRTTPRYRCS